MSNFSQDAFARTWKNSSRMKRWFEREFDEHWKEGCPETRDDWDGEGRWFWIVPDHVKGRSRIVGVDRGLLEQEGAPARVQQTLQMIDWLKRIDIESILVTQDERGTPCVVSWNPDVEEQWFPDPKGGYFVAYETTAHAVSVAGPPAFTPEPFLALDGATWSATGPVNPRSPKSYSIEELLPYLPEEIE